MDILDYAFSQASFAESTLILQESKAFLNEAFTILDVPTITAYLRMLPPTIKYDQNLFAAIVAVALAKKHSLDLSTPT
jgi:hypothetical protein